jgi:hypothetical protein
MRLEGYVARNGDMRTDYWEELGVEGRILLKLMLKE